MRKLLLLTLFGLPVIACAHTSGASPTTLPEPAPVLEGAPESTGTELPFETWSEGGNYGRAEPGYFVIGDQETLEALMNPALEAAFHPAPEVGPFDFTDHMLIAAFLGVVSSGGSGITIQSVVEMEETVDVGVVQHSTVGCPVTQAIEYPHHIVVVQRVDKPVRFFLSTQQTVCEDGGY